MARRRPELDSKENFAVSRKLMASSSAGFGHDTGLSCENDPWDHVDCHLCVLQANMIQC